MFENYLITSSCGYGNYILTSFDNALFNSKIGNYNLVRVSSILPAGCRKRSLINITEGAPLHVAYASITSNEINDRISSAIAVGIPEDTNKVGVIMEFSAHSSEMDVRRIVESMVKEAMDRRGYEIKEIVITSCEAVSTGREYVTAFSGLAMW